MTLLTCPHCNTEIDYYLEDTEPDDWIITIPHPPGCAKGDGRECVGKSHDEWTELVDYELICRWCGEASLFSCTYIQPCNANGYVYKMALEASE